MAVTKGTDWLPVPNHKDGKSWVRFVNKLGDLDLSKYGGYALTGGFDNLGNRDIHLSRYAYMFVAAQYQTGTDRMFVAAEHADDFSDKNPVVAYASYVTEDGRTVPNPSQGEWVEKPVFTYRYMLVQGGDSCRAVTDDEIESFAFYAAESGMLKGKMSQHARDNWLYRAALYAYLRIASLTDGALAIDLQGIVTLKKKKEQALFERQEKRKKKNMETYIKRRPRRLDRL